MSPVRGRNLARILRSGAAITVLAAAFELAMPGHATAANCLYPDKAGQTGPSYNCLRPVEKPLIDLRKFRAELTVAALRCKQQSTYNQIISRHKGELVKHGKALGSVFQRLHGRSGKSELNRYVTHLTNRASMRSLGVRDYCGSMTQVLYDALRTPIKGLMSFVRGKPIARAESMAVLPAAPGLKSTLRSISVPK